MNYYEDYEVMSAPNRYRKLIPKEILSPSGQVVFGGSHSMMWFFHAAWDNEESRDRAKEMMMEDWPDKAHRAIGMEPTITLDDVILIWEKE